jgi:hypothetical protein
LITAGLLYGAPDPLLLVSKITNFCAVIIGSNRAGIVEVIGFAAQIDHIA